MSVDVQRVKAFNDELKKYNDKAAKNSAEMEFNNREIKRICDELSVELNMEVTPENIATIAKERIAKIENTLQSGESILARIKQEEEAEANGDMQSNNVAQQQVNNGAYQMPSQQPVQQVMQQPAQQQPAQQTMQQPVQQEYQIDQFSQQPQVQQAMPQMQPFGGIPNMGSFPTFQVGSKPQQSQAVPSQEIGDVNLFGSGAVQI